MLQIKRNFFILILLLMGSKIPLFSQSVIEVHPSENRLNVAKDTVITVRFDSSMDQSTINDTTFVVYGSYRGIYTGTYSYNSGTETSVFDPDSSFMVGEAIHMIITRGIQTLNGDSLLNPYQWSFTAEVDEGSGKFHPQVTYSTGSNPRSVYSTDLNNDGAIDLAVVNAGSNDISILINIGGLFQIAGTYSVGDYPVSIILSHSFSCSSTQ